jgi:endo-1,4-beta-xylanase
MADDDTWLDGFPVTRTDYPLPFDMNLQAKPAYWGIVDPTKLPGYGLKFSITGDTDGSNTRVITLTATNGDVGPAYATQISSVSLGQVFGRPCSPVVTPPSAYPVLLGDIAAGGSASAAFSINLTGCDPFARFVLKAPWNSSVYHTGTFVSDLEARSERDDKEK